MQHITIWGEDMIFLKIENDKLYIKRETEEKILTASLFTLTDDETKQLNELKER